VELLVEQEVDAVLVELLEVNEVVAVVLEPLVFVADCMVDVAEEEEELVPVVLELMVELDDALVTIELALVTIELTLVTIELALVTIELALVAACELVVVVDDDGELEADEVDDVVVELDDVLEWGAFSTAYAPIPAAATIQTTMTAMTAGATPLLFRSKMSEFSRGSLIKRLALRSTTTTRIRSLSSLDHAHVTSLPARAMQFLSAPPDSGILKQRQVIPLSF